MFKNRLFIKLLSLTFLCIPFATVKADTAKMNVGDIFQDCDTNCPEMVILPTGTYRMGDVQGGGEDNEKPVQSVIISNKIAMSKYMVTFDDWYACVDAGGCTQKPEDKGWGKGKRPVMNVSWDDAQVYVKWLSKVTGETYRLPSEAEWEYAARSGTDTKYNWGNTANHEMANYGTEECCEGLISGRDEWFNSSPSGSFPPNQFGLYDMYGNIWEWVEDCWNENHEGAPNDGSARTTTGTCETRVLRGGGWSTNPENIRAAYRIKYASDSKNSYFGIRLVRELD